MTLRKSLRAVLRFLRRGPWWRRGLKLLFLVLILFYAGIGLILLTLRFVNPPTTAVQMQRRLESRFSSGYSKRSTFVPLNRISPHLIHAVIAAEDGRFYLHSGVDWEELRKAMQANLARGSFWRGGSTISQQLVKNLFLSTRLGILRKGLELMIVFPAEWVLGKDRILELYLNVIEWGPGIYGIEEAARAYYGRSARDLDRRQAARLAACIPAPLRRHPETMDDYSSDILLRMSKMGW